MHIPDGFLNVSVSAASGALSLGSLAVALRLIRKRFEDRTIPIMGVMAAFIFAAQMFNFPIAGGTSGHLLGGVLAAVVLGPFAASIIMACVLIVQCFLFQDGGLIALGANILNMAIVGTWSGWFIYATLKKLLPGSWGWSSAVFVGAWFSVVIASALAALELATSGTIPLERVFLAMVGIHALIGLAEAMITLMVLSFLKKVKPELIA